MKLALPEQEEPELQIAPLIDMTFLLLIYFLCTCSLVTPEADLGIRLPGVIVTPEKVDMPDEQIVEVREGGRVLWNGSELDRAGSRELTELAARLAAYKVASDASRNEAMITIMAEETTRHQRVIDVMNACAAAKIKNVTFAGGGG